MNFPKPTKDNINLSGKDLKNTDEMEILTKEINKNIQNKEDEISNFYKFFNNFEQWIKLNKQKITNVESFKNLIIARLNFLNGHIKKTTVFLENLKKITISEEKIDSEKIMNKIDLSKDFSLESDFAKNLKYPNKIIHLAKDISKKLDSTKEDVTTDLTIEKKTEELIDHILEMLNKIAQKLNDFSNFVLITQDFSNFDAKIDEFVIGIQNENEAFEKLNKFEKIHLNLLLELAEKEKTTLIEETEFKNAEEELK